MTLWDCFEGYGNELECRQMISNPLPRAPSLLGTDVSWCRIIEEYTRRKITKDTDRFPALSGLAEQYRKATGKTYLAGLWLEDLPFMLLWRLDPDSEVWLESPTAYCAPSWSWASLKGPVDLVAYSLDEGDEPTTSVIAAHCEYCPPGALSRVTSGWLDLEGPITLVTGYRHDGVKLGVFINGEGEKDWLACLDQNTTCTEEDVAQSKIFLLKSVIMHQHRHRHSRKNNSRPATKGGRAKWRERQFSKDRACGVSSTLEWRRGWDQKVGKREVYV